MSDPKIDTPKALYNILKPKWDKIDILMEGTDAMRAAGTTYLPQEEEESSAAYSARLNRSFLLEVLEPTIDNCVGRVFREPIIVDNVSGEVEEWLDNVNLSGMNLNEFFRDIFKSTIAHGITHVLVDYPTINESNRPISKEDENNLKLRPYLRHITAPELIYWKSDRVDGVEKLVEVRIKEQKEISVGYGDVYIDVIRVLRPNDYEVWEYRENDNKKKEWILTESGEISLGEIPLISIYAKRKGFMNTTPPFMGFASKNIEQWQKASDLSNILHFACTPFLFYQGLDQEEIEAKQKKPVGIGVSRAQYSRNPNADVKWIDHSGASIKAGEEHHSKLVEQMAALGMGLFLKRPGGETATAKAIDKSETDSKLTAWALSLQKGIKNTILMMAKWRGLEVDPTVSVNTDFGIKSDVAFITELLKMRQANQISHETFLHECKRRGLLSDEFEYAVEQERILTESNNYPTPGPTLDIEDEE
jgi:Domain of unknown function (DUF4055)